MTEKEKMLSGMGYNSMVDELINDRLRAKTLCKRFNDTKPNEIKERKLILSELFSKANDCFIEPNFFCDYGYNIEIGENFFANHNCVILDVNKVIIGKNVM
ncbi:MAG: maltose O-acetyltransferase, partial [Firmicutes bacterium]|nr:maltose O-acetyltransferase [Bacillota bacterium]